MWAAWRELRALSVLAVLVAIAVPTLAGPEGLFGGRQPDYLTIKLPPPKRCFNPPMPGYLELSAQNADYLHETFNNVSVRGSVLLRMVGSKQDEVNQILDVVVMLSTSGKNMRNALCGKMLKLAKKIPKVGKIANYLCRFLDLVVPVAESIEDGIDHIETKLGNITKALNTTNRYLQKASKAFKYTSIGYRVRNVAREFERECAGNDCEKVSRFQRSVDGEMNFELSEPAGPSYVLSSTVTAIEEIKAFPGKILAWLEKLAVKALKAILNEIMQLLQPILDFITNVINTIADALSEAYCCVTPLAVQNGVAIVGKVMDLISCPADGAFTALLNSFQLVLERVKTQVFDVFNRFFQDWNDMIQQFQSNLDKVNITLPEVTRMPDANLSCITLTVDIGEMKWNRLDLSLDNLRVQIKKFPPTPPMDTNIFSNIANACKEAWDSFEDVDTGMCCKDYVAPDIPDGIPCDPTGLGPARISCGMCRSGKSYMTPTLITLCGTGPTWPDGTLCGLGTTCNYCTNKSQFWYSKLMTACGSEPKWPDGTLCLLGTSCDRCKNKATFWSTKVGLTACGRQPCFKKGTVCAPLISCGQCCNGSKWYGKCK